MMGLQIFFKIAQSAIFALLLIGCAHSVSPEGSQQDTSVVQQRSSALWHDGSTGGLYGIGLGWRIELLPAEYETVTETIIIGPAAIDFIVVPAESEWVKHDGEDLGSGPIMETRLFMLPEEYETVPDTIVVAPSRSEYYVAGAVYGSSGDIITPKTVKQRTIPAMTKQQERRVVKVPTRTEKRLVPVERRKGYRRVVKTEAYVKEVALPTKPKTLSREIIKRPYKFVIRNPDGEVTHVFSEHEDLISFINSLNQPMEELSGKTFKIVKVNDYVLPKEPPHIRVRFENGKIYLVSSCNSTWGTYELTGDLFTLGAMGNLGQHAYTELIEKPDGSVSERTAQTPNVITENGFIALGDKSFKIQPHQNEVYFADKSGNIVIILERYL